MKKMHLADHIYDNVTFNTRTPDGVANIIIVEHSPGKIYKIFFTIGKAGSSTNAWAFALCEVVVDSLNRGADINDMITLLSNITSSRPIYDNDGIACRSGPEALYHALFRYRIMNKDTFNKDKVTYSEDYRPARLGN